MDTKQCQKSQACESFGTFVAINQGPTLSHHSPGIKIMNAIDAAQRFFV
jgi:hypothetical protein